MPRSEAAHYSLMLAYRNAGRHGRGAAREGGARQTAEAAGGRVHGVSEETRREAAGEMKPLRSRSALCGGRAPAATLPEFRDIAAGCRTHRRLPERRHGDQGVHHRDHRQRGRADRLRQRRPPRCVRHQRRRRAQPSVSQRGQAAGSGTSRQRWASRAPGWGQGACAGDYDNDGYTDLFVTYWGQNILYRNEGGKRFRDVTKRGRTDAGPDPLQHRLRLPGLRPRRPPRPVRRQLPEVQLRGDAQARRESVLLVFADAGELRSARPSVRSATCCTTPTPTAPSPTCPRRAGSPGRIRTTASTALTGDFDDDGWPDIFVACDQTPSLLYMNQQRRHVLGRGAVARRGAERDGKAMSGMGATAADYDAHRLAEHLPLELLGRARDAVPQSRQRRVRRRHAAGRHGPQHALRGLGLRVLRLRQRRLEGPAAGERPRLPRSGAQEARHPFQGPPHPVSQSAATGSSRTFRRRPARPSRTGIRRAAWPWATSTTTARSKC